MIDAESTVNEILAMRAKLDAVQTELAKSPDKRTTTECTRICLEDAKDTNGRQVEIGDWISDEYNGITGIVIGLAGKAVLVQTGPQTFDSTFTTQCVSASPTAA